ncbi:hypothetical protein PCE1_003920 [Barthelona sp. PCE]
MDPKQELAALDEPCRGFNTKSRITRIATVANSTSGAENGLIISATDKSIRIYDSFIERALPALSYAGQNVKFQVVGAFIIVTMFGSMKIIGISQQVKELMILRISAIKLWNFGFDPTTESLVYIHKKKRYFKIIGMDCTTGEDTYLKEHYNSFLGSATTQTMFLYRTALEEDVFPRKQRITIINIKSGEIIATFDTPVGASRWENEDVVVYVHGEGRRRYNISTEEYTEYHKPNKKRVFSEGELSVIPDGPRLLLHTQDGELVSEMRAPTPYAVNFNVTTSPCNQFYVCGGLDHTVNLYDKEAGYAYTLQQNQPKNAAYASVIDGRIVHILAFDRLVSERDSFDIPMGATSVTVTGRGHFAVGFADGTVRLFNSEELLKEYNFGYSKSIHSMFAHGNALLALSTGSSTIIDLETDNTSVLPDLDTINTACFLDANTIVYNANPGHLRCLSLKTMTFEPIADLGCALAGVFASDDWIIAGTVDGHTHILHRGNTFKRISGCVDMVHALEWIYDHKEEIDDYIAVSPDRTKIGFYSACEECVHSLKAIDSLYTHLRVKATCAN